MLGGLVPAVWVRSWQALPGARAVFSTGTAIYDLGEVVSAFARARLPVFVNKYAASVYLGTWQLQQAGLPKPTEPWIPNGIPDFENDFYVYVFRSPALASAFVAFE